ncbi:MAG: hypothetical protein Q4B82_07340 [Alysiella sp.]|uniref:hypothetical protein n=1 Tax=Alysiella sp. TaxID=1872483 RepID=UPI0026DB1128|nr:hypothetical protein [Alysiella sp.]MDO4434375.1 hypothetical protein [Alysiella sp.]
MKRHTAITRQDLKIYKSQRLTDTPDGGGMMTNQPLVGADNELFEPISDVDRTMGAFDTRLIYPAVLRDDDHKLLGANVIVSQPPQADNASILLVPADHYGQERASIMERIEAYRVPTVENRMTLLGTQLKGSRLVQVYQMVTAALPVVGQVLALRVMVNGAPVYDFIRIERFSHSIETYEENNVEFQRRLIKMVTQQPLERDFIGTERVSRHEVLPPARVLETQIADSAKYYGIKPLAQPIVAGAASLKLPTIYEQLVPVSVVETLLVDDWAQGREMWIETGPKRVMIGNQYVSKGKSLFLDTPILPFSVQLSGYKDDGSGSLKAINSDHVLSIDYANGVISGFGGQWVSDLQATPAVRVRNYAFSGSITIDDTNMGTAFAPEPLRPAPARGSVQVAYQVGREWYTLTDKGDYVLRDETGTSRGTVTKNGSIVINLPAQPDSGSKIVFSWCPHQFYQTIDEQDAGNVIAPQTLSPELTLPETPMPNLKPNSIRLTWQGGSARDDGQGNLVGDCKGTVNYAAGQVYPKDLNASEVQFSAKQYIASPQTTSIKPALGANDITILADVLQKGSLKLALHIQRQTTTGYRAVNLVGTSQ